MPSLGSLETGAAVSNLEASKGQSKVDVDHLEISGTSNPTFGLNPSDEKPFTGMRRLLKRNPSLEFFREVAKLNEKELDPVEVKRV